MGLHVAGSVLLLVAVLVATALGRERLGRLRRASGRAADRVRALRTPPPTPVVRPIEAIAHDVQRLGMRFRSAPGASFAKFEGRRQAYEVVLVEACRALEVEHLLEVLPPGSELDAERQRVESMLAWAGLRLDDAA
jgi:hypothetical protein